MIIKTLVPKFGAWWNSGSVGWALSSVLAVSVIITTATERARTKVHPAVALGALASRAEGPPLFAVLLLTPLDCQGDLAQLRRLVPQLREKEIQVSGLVLTDDDPSDWTSAIESYHLPMSYKIVASARANWALNRLGIRSTPTILIYNELTGSFLTASIPAGLAQMERALANLD